MGLIAGGECTPACACSGGAAACRCGEVLRGLINPPECSIFGTGCTPEHPVGPCMVSTEGTCAAWFLYRPGG